jgi:hypothetical protein
MIMEMTMSTFTSIGQSLSGLEATRGFPNPLGLHPSSVAAVLAPCRQVPAMSSYPRALPSSSHDQIAAKIAAVAARKPTRNDDRLQKRFHVVGVEFA